MSENFRIMAKDKYIRFDWAAKRILRDKANYSVLEGFISVLLDEDVRICDILESESNQNSSDAKFNRVDVMTRNDKGELFIIEIQQTRQVHYLERILFGVGKAVTEHLQLGEEYAKVKKVYSISILYFDLCEGDDYVYHGQTTFLGLHTGSQLQVSERNREAFRMRTPQEVFPEYYLIMVNEFDKVATTPLDEWIEYLKSGKIRPDTSVKGLREAREKLLYVSMDEAERRAYDRHLEDIMYEKDVLLTAKLEGIEEGRAEGREEGRAEGREEGIRAEKLLLASRMKEAGIDITQISAITGLSANEVASV